MNCVLSFTRTASVCEPQLMSLILPEERGADLQVISRRHRRHEVDPAKTQAFMNEYLHKSEKEQRDAFLRLDKGIKERVVKEAEKQGPALLAAHTREWLNVWNEAWHQTKRRGLTGHAAHTWAWREASKQYE